jgi:hypothetical protein
MTANPTLPECHLHFEGDGRRGHAAVPGAAATQRSPVLPRSTALRAIACEGQPMEQHLGIGDAMERKGG